MITIFAVITALPISIIISIRILKLVAREDIVNLCRFLPLGDSISRKILQSPRILWFLGIEVESKVESDLVAEEIPSDDRE